MELKISNKFENKLLNRIEIEASVLHAKEPTPKRAEMRKLLAAQLGADESLLVIRKFSSKIGAGGRLLAMLYKSKEDLQKTEPKYIIGRETGQKMRAKAKALAAPSG